MTFKTKDPCTPVRQALRKNGYTGPAPVQKQVGPKIPFGIDVLVSSIMHHAEKAAAQNKKEISITQSVYYVERESKHALLNHIITEKRMQNVLVFARTKYSADKIAKDLNRSGITAEAFHGDKSQHVRVKALSNFRKKVTRVLVATDIAAGCIDITDLPFIINYELPDSAETYTHRIERTGKAGAAGTALSLCDREEKGQLKNISRTQSAKLQVIEHPFT